MAETVMQAKKDLHEVREKLSGNIRKKVEKVAKKQPPVNRAKLLVSIVNQDDEQKLKGILDDVSVALAAVFSGTGTARSTVLDYLGIGETEKAVVLSLFPESDEEAIMREIRSQMSLYLVGRGISFTVPLTGVSEIIANGITNAATNKNTDGSKIMNADTRKYSLIVAIVSAGHVDEAMNAARAAGAAGGTIVRSRSLDNKKAEQFIGISLAVEQEILLILVKKESAMAIMEALSVRVGVKSEAGGVIFSLPVDKTAGISAADEEETQEEEKK